MAVPFSSRAGPLHFALGQTGPGDPGPTDDAKTIPVVPSGQLTVAFIFPFFASVLASTYIGSRLLGARLRYQFSDYEVDVGQRELRHAGRVVAIEPQVFDLLAFLIANSERLVTKDELLAAVWEGRVVSESAMTTRINAARCAVGDNGREQRLIKTLRGKGFRFIAAVREVEVGRPPRSDFHQLALNKLTIGVRPFRNASLDPNADWFAIGFAEHLAGLLCEHPWLSVRALGFEYGGAPETQAILARTSVQYVLCAHRSIATTCSN